MNQGITIRMGAAASSLSVQGTVLDLSTMSSDDRYTVRRTLIEELKKKGYFGLRHQKRARFAERKRAQ